MKNNQKNKLLTIKARALCLLIAIVYLYADVEAQSSLIQFHAQKGVKTLIRTDNTRTYFVTHYEPTGTNCYFIIQHGNAAKYINLMQEYENVYMLHPFGYEINDMRIIGQDCYFCGSKWTETGNIIYGLDGSTSFERKHKGFIGRFNVAEAFQSGGNFDIMEIDTTYSLDKLAVLPGRALATATLYDGYTKSIVELKDVNHVGNYTDYTYKIFLSQIPDEYFMDVTATTSKFVTVSRYSDPLNANSYNYLFGLRYGSGFDFSGNNTGLNNYSTQNVLNSGGASFVSMEPVHITSTNVDDGVVVAYVNKNQTVYNGNVIMYNINSEGQTITDILNGSGIVKFTKIKEIGFNRPLVSTTKMVVLLEDKYNLSILRFPYWGRTSLYHDTILFSDSLVLQSIAPFQNMSNSLDVRVSGYNPYSSNKVVQLEEEFIHYNSGYWSTNSCIDNDQNTWQPLTETVPASFVTSELNLFFQSTNMLFTEKAYTPRTVSKITTLCQ